MPGPSERMRRAWCYEFPSQGPFPDADSSGFLGVPDSIDEDEAVFDSDLFEQHVRRRVGIRSKIVKLIHRNFPVSGFR
jgi:hypothetical protein